MTPVGEQISVAARYRFALGREPREQYCVVTARISSRTHCAGRVRGFTLIELVIAIVALAALGAGIAVVFITGPAASADPQIRAQARAIAEGYVEEILLKAYRDPEGLETGGVEAGEDRPTYDDVWDYCDIGNDNDCSGGTEDPTDQDGNPMAGGALTDYQVTVVIQGSPGSGPATVRVTVGHASARVNYELVSQRAEY